MKTHGRRVYYTVWKTKAWKNIKQGKCPVCGKPKNEWNRRTDWTCCSKECTEKSYKEIVVVSWEIVKYSIFKRDDYICQKCGIKTVQGYDTTKDDFPECDHIIPVALGGREFDVNNLQTLCKKCHKEKTKVDIVKIAEYRAWAEPFMRLDVLFDWPLCYTNNAENQSTLERFFK